MAKFEREERYVVIKISDIEHVLSSVDQARLGGYLCDIQRHRVARGASGDIEAVVITKNMACYDAAWKLVEDEVNGKV